jgi:PEP-CTERM motif
VRFHNGFTLGQVRSAESAKWCFMLATGLLAIAALPALASPINFSECPAVGDDTTGCALLITVTATNGMGTATAFTVTASGGPTSYDGGDGTLIGVLNSPSDSGGVFSINFTVAPGTGTFAFDEKGACEATGSPLVDIYSPAPTALQCLQGQYQTEDAYDYASAGVTFTSFNLADAGIITSGTGPLGPGQFTWFSLPGDITASDISMVTPEPSLLWLLGVGIIGLGFLRHRKAV